MAVRPTGRLRDRGSQFYQALREDLIEFAERDFALNSPLEEGGTYGEALAAQLKRTKDPKRRKELQDKVWKPPFPRELLYLWRLFWRLRRRKAGNGWGPNPIEWPDIDAFVRHARLVLTPFEIETIELLDDAFLRAVAEKRDLDDGDTAGEE